MKRVETREIRKCEHGIQYTLAKVSAHLYFDIEMGKI